MVDRPDLPSQLPVCRDLEHAQMRSYWKSYLEVPVNFCRSGCMAAQPETVYHNALDATLHTMRAIIAYAGNLRKPAAGHHCRLLPIIKRVGSGGFSLIYLAEDEDSQERVIFKEYLPRKLAQRSGSTRVEIAPDPPARISSNGAASSSSGGKSAPPTYAIPTSSKYAHFSCQQHRLPGDGVRTGRNLASYIKRHNGKLSETPAADCFPAILDALTPGPFRKPDPPGHQPSNIHLRSGGRPLLLDFGAIHQLATTRRAVGIPGYHAGFSPVEQYYSSGYVGPWSDIYAIGRPCAPVLRGRPAIGDRTARKR